MRPAMRYSVAAASGSTVPVPGVVVVMTGTSSSVSSTIVEYVGAVPSVGLRICVASRRNLSCRRLLEDVPDQRRTGREFQPSVDVLEVGCYGSGTDKPPLADLSVGQALRDQAGHLLLPDAQPPLFVVVRRGRGPPTQLA